MRPSSIPFEASPARTSMSADAFRRAVLEHLYFTRARSLKEATALDLYAALSHAVRDRLVHRWIASRNTFQANSTKRVCYLSSEFLVGRSLGLCLVNLGLYDTAKGVLAERGFELSDVLEREGDPGLGNGGLGRLAACFMDSLATLELPAIGYGIRYDFGIFEQLIEDGWQVERRDNWLQFGNPWEIPRHERTQVVRFGGHVQHHQQGDGRIRADWSATTEVLGLPFDSFIIGHRTNNVNTLRLWSARATRDFNLAVFNQGDFLRAVEEKVETESISKVLYPADHSERGRMLRLKQQYFFVACSLGDVVRRHKREHTSLDNLPERAAIQLNDTHPSIAVAELMRLLVDEEQYSWERAWSITERTLAYTNHTLMPEALEKWPVPMFQALLPRHLEIIFEINKRFLRAVHVASSGDKVIAERVSLIEEGPVKQIRMANLAVVGSYSVNGVAALHTDLIRTELFPEFAALWPEKFNNKTNGVSQRRWLVHANPALGAIISDRIGTAWAERSFGDLRRLLQSTDDPQLLNALNVAKLTNKNRLADHLRRKCGFTIDPTWMLVAQVKRIHEYKRQLLAVLQIAALYQEIKDNPSTERTPQIFLFSGKAAAAYRAAKEHIKLIHDVADIINGDPATRDKLQIVFVPNYGVSWAELIIPAADLSLQISLAGLEASGTGNMKLAMNGAITVGTLDGANVEIFEEVGPQNMYCFGLQVEEVKKLRESGYDPQVPIQHSPRLRRVLEALRAGFFNWEDPRRFEFLAHQLTTEDRFMVCADFESYWGAMERAANDYRDRQGWARKALVNIATSPRFSSDETIAQYARDIWKIRPLPVEIQEAGPSEASPLPREPLLNARLSQALSPGL